MSASAVGASVVLALIAPFAAIDFAPLLFCAVLFPATSLEGSVLLAPHRPLVLAAVVALGVADTAGSALVHRSVFPAVALAFFWLAMLYRFHRSVRPA